MFTETNYEKALISLFKDDLGYDYQYGPEIERDHHKVVLEDVLRSKLFSINKGVHRKAINEAMRKILNPEGISLVHQNKYIHDMVVNGVDVSYHDGKGKNAHVNLIDFANASNNVFLLVNQYTVEENLIKRPDLVIFITVLLSLYLHWPPSRTISICP